MATEKSVVGVIRAARPTFRNNQDKIAFVVHASFHAAGYLLTATGIPALSESALSSTSSDEVGIDNWNEVDGEYGFVYVNPENLGKRVLVKCLAMNDQLVVSALLVDAGSNSGADPVHMEISVNNYVGENGASNYSEQFKKLDKLISSINTEVLSKLGGSSHSGSSSESRSQASDTSRHAGNEPRNPSHNPSPHPSGVIVPPVPPFGMDDLVPGAGAGMYPRRGGFGGDGGMLLGPNDPRWFGGDNGGLGFPGAQPGVPPGARFDPYGPPGIPEIQRGLEGEGALIQTLSSLATALITSDIAPRFCTRISNDETVFQKLLNKVVCDTRSRFDCTYRILEANRHTIILMQASPNRATRTFMDFGSISQAMEGICGLYERKLKEINPALRNLSYDIADLYNFIDGLADLSALVYDHTIQAYLPYDRQWIKQKTFQHLKKLAH
ncbi:unnamed protein product [Linum tenue]|uniref:Proteasome inhibitor n=1 Tax=Linum tenue TaxID=586396 RepID=A0AAV0LWT7_9ROSI|nr:unnamed protein product [Linum tenue]